MKQRIVIGTILFLILFSMAPTFYEWNARGRIHADRFFELVHNFPTDYNLYLSKIRQGKEGSWLAREKYTSEPHNGSLLQILYVTIGRLAHFAHVQTPYVWFAYHTARIFFAFFLLFVIWKVSEWIFSQHAFVWQYMVFLLIALQSTWPKFEIVRGVPRLGGWMPWYTQADSLQRTTFMPHVTFAQGLMVFILWVFSGGFISRKHPMNAVFLGVVGIVLGIIFPPGLMFIYGILGLVTIWEFLKIWWERGLGGKRITMTHMKKWYYESLFDRFIFGIISVPTLLYYSLLLSEYPWKRLVEFDVLHPTKFSFVEYFMAVGPLLPFGLISIIVLVILRNQDLLSKVKYFVAWVIAWLAFIYIFDKIPQQSPTRFTQMVPQVPLGVLTGVVLYEVIQIITKALSAIRMKSTNGELRIVNSELKQKRFALFTIQYSLFSIPIVIIFLSLSSMASSYMWLRDFVDHKLRATIPLVPHAAEVMYPMKDIVEGMIWLQVHTPRDAVVLTGDATGNYVPVYSGNTAYIGHANTVQMEQKTAAMQNFYKQHLSIAEELAYIRNAKIDYIFYGPEEFEISGGVEDLRALYPTLTLVYENPLVKIYKIP